MQFRYLLVGLLFHGTIFCSQPRPVMSRQSLETMLQADLVNANSDMVNSFLYTLSQCNNLDSLVKDQGRIFSCLAQPQYKGILNRQLVVDGNQDHRTFCQLLLEPREEVSLHRQALLKRLFENKLVDTKVKNALGNTIVHMIAGIKPFDTLGWTFSYYLTGDDLRLEDARNIPAWKLIILNESANDEVLEKLIYKLNPTDSERQYMYLQDLVESDNTKNIKKAYYYAWKAFWKKMALRASLFLLAMGIVYKTAKHYGQKELFMVSLEAIQNLLKV